MDRSTDPNLEAGALFQPLGERKVSCAKHGDYFANGTRLSKGREIWTRCAGCSEDERLEEKRARDLMAAQAAQADLERKLEQTAIPPRFLGKSLENFNAETEEQRYALTVARGYLENFADHHKRGDGLILSGMPGTGKSHLAGAILQGLLPRYVGLYATCMNLIRMVRGTWRKDSETSENQVLETLCHVPLLVIDEIGVQYGTDGEQTILFDVLDGRYRNMRPTILLTNQDKAGLKTFIGERAYDRLTETSRWIPFDWKSYRLQARKDAS